jgi:hypothetical protein
MCAQSLGKARWMLGGTAAARQVFGAAISQLGPLPQLYQQWITLEQRAQLIPAARAVLGVQNAVANGQAQQQQQQPKQRLRRTRPAGGQMQDLQQQGSSSNQDGAAGTEQYVAQLHQLLATLKAQALGTAAAGQAQGPSGAVLPSAGSLGQQQQDPQQQPQWQQRRKVLRQWQAEAAADMQQAEAQQQQQQQGVLHQQEEQFLQQEMGFQQQQANHQQQQQHMQQRLDGSSKKKKSSSSQHEPASASAHVPSLVSAAVMEHRAGNLGKAQQLYAAALQLEPSNPKLLHSMVQMYLKEGDRAAAEQHLAALQVGGEVQLLRFLVSRTP